MEILCCTLIGYGLGCISPSALIGKLKHTDLRSEGTKNLGGSNTLLVIGRFWGVLVMLLDILKGFFAAKFAHWLFPHLTVAQVVAGLAAVVGHIFPFYMGFKGGKGLAAFGGLVLAYDPWMFLILLTVGLIGMFVANASVAVPLSAGVLFPILVGLRSHDLAQTLICVAAGLLLIIVHWSNIERARSGKELDLRRFFKNGLKDK